MYIINPYDFIFNKFSLNVLYHSASLARNVRIDPKCLVTVNAMATAEHFRITFLFGIKVTLSRYRQCILMVFYEKYRVLCIFVGKRR